MDREVSRRLRLIVELSAAVHPDRLDRWEMTDECTDLDSCSVSCRAGSSCLFLGLHQAQARS